MTRGISDETFDQLVDSALAQIPAELLGLIEQCVLIIEDEPPPEHPDILGLYEGIPLTERESGMFLTEPDRIYIFRRPLRELCETEPQLAHEIRITVIHEIAHYFGISDERLHELGWS